MGRSCCVEFCKSVHKTGLRNGIGYHEIPSNTEVREQWIKMILSYQNRKKLKSSSWVPNDRDVICSLHFRPEDYVEGLRHRIKLKPGAIPSVFDGYRGRKVKAKSTKPTEPLSSESTCHAADDSKVHVVTPSPYIHETSFDDEVAEFPAPRAFQQNIQYYEEENEENRCYLCWKMFKVENSKSDKLNGVYLDTCRRYLDLNIVNIGVPDQVQNTPMLNTNSSICYACNDSVKELSTIVINVEKVKKELEEFCQSFSKRLRDLRKELVESENRNNSGIHQDRHCNDPTIHNNHTKHTESGTLEDFVVKSEIDDVDDDFSTIDECLLEDDSEPLNEEANISINANFQEQKMKNMSIIIERLKVIGSHVLYCSTCNTMWNDRKSFTKHGASHEKQVKRVVKPRRKLICAECGITPKGNLRRHVILCHTSDRPFKCSFCPKAFKFKADLTIHEFPHKAGRTHVCNICGKGFLWLRNLKSHLIKVHKTGAAQNTNNLKLKCKPTHLKCEECGLVIRSGKIAFEDHKRLHTGEKPFKCVDCDEYFRTKLNLQVHKIKEHVKDFPFSCDQCYMKFKMKCQLSCHRVTNHSRPDEMVICEDCGKSFKRFVDYAIHRRVIHEKKRYKCEQCEKTFGRTSERNFHVKLVHTKVIAFVCEICSKECGSLRKLQDHIRTHTGEKPFQCNECGKYFTSRTALGGHRTTVHRSNQTGTKNPQVNVT